MDRIVCPACNSDRIKQIYERIFECKKIFSCEVCGLYFIWPVSFIDKIEYIYSEEYYNAWSLQELGKEGIDKMKRATFQSLFDILTPYKRIGSILDIGCAFGNLLEVAKERGWDCYGLDISQYAAKQAKNKIGADKIWIGDFLDSPLPRNNFDLITMVDFLEHTCYIREVFKKCKGLLRDEGLLVIVTPDINSFSHKYMGRHWLHFKEEHVTYFSRKCIHIILEMNGIKLIKAQPFKKSINFLYFKSQIYIYGGALFKLAIRISDVIIPKDMKRKNFFMPQGEMLIIARNNRVH